MTQETTREVVSEIEERPSLLKGIAASSFILGGLMEVFALEATGADSAYFAKRGGALLAVGAFSEIARRLSYKEGPAADTQQAE